jgi:hypothetical protein
MAGSLLIPRCEMKWGKVNLSSYDGNDDFPQNEPLVFDVEVHLESQNTAPTATVNWNPSGKAYKVYENLVTNNIKDIITTRFYYVGGKSITFSWVWSGQAVSFGNDMSVKINLTSTLAGLVNSNQRNVNQVYDKPSTGLAASQSLPNLYGVDPNIVVYNKVAEKDMGKYKINNHYAKDSTFGSAINNIAQQNGNFITPTNIGDAKMVVFAPYSWDKTATIQDGATLPKGKEPDPKERYGYIVGPSIINSLERTVDFSTPQQTRTKSPGTQTRAVQKPTKSTGASNKSTANPTPQQTSQDQAQKKTKAALGTSGAAANPGISNANNPDGPKKQQILQNENTAKMQFQTFVVPVLMGIKPNDIVFVPSLNGQYIEDWIVQSVTYHQTDGGVEVSVSGTRIYGTGDLMNPAAGKTFMSQAKQLKTLEDWDNYAWSLNRNLSGTTTSSTNVLPVASTPAAQAQQEFSVTRTANIA